MAKGHWLYNKEKLTEKVYYINVVPEEYALLALSDKNHRNPEHMTSLKGIILYVAHILWSFLWKIPLKIVRFKRSLCIDDVKMMPAKKWELIIFSEKRILRFGII